MIIIIIIIIIIFCFLLIINNLCYSPFKNNVLELHTTNLYQTNIKDKENYCKYVSSRGLLLSCHIHSYKPISGIKKLIGYDFSQLKENCSIYITTSAIPEFVKILPYINVKFYLVSGDAIESCPYDIFNNDDFIKFINNEKIIAWYAQNCTISHPKLFKLPLGLDYHSQISGLNLSPLENEKFMIHYKNISKPFYEREIKCHASFQFVTDLRFGYDRIDAMNQIPKELVYYEPNRISRDKLFENQIKYAFVISPHGNGLDCHRTWEALCIGCIPIVKTSPLDSLYDDLPVLIVNEWSDVNLSLLEKTISNFKNKIFNYDKLLLKYWTDKWVVFNSN